MNMKRQKEILSRLKLHGNTLNIHFVIKNMSYITIIFLDENSFIECLRLSSGKKIFWSRKPLSYINRGNAVNAHRWCQLRFFFCSSKYSGSMAFVSLVGPLFHFISVDIFLLKPEWPQWYQSPPHKQKFRLFSQGPQPYLKISYFFLSSQESSPLDQPLQFFLSKSAIRDEAGLF